jgi:hypothetical protein
MVVAVPERRRDGGSRALRREQPGPNTTAATATNGTTDGLSVADGRVADVVDLAAWRRLRRAPAGGDWWGGRQMWSWGEAERSRRRLPA